VRRGRKAAGLRDEDSRVAKGFDSLRGPAFLFFGVKTILRGGTVCDLRDLFMLGRQTTNVSLREK
jgi:hypothetical protein